MNKQSKDGNISWTDYTWNPIKGLCPVGCWYCYARKMYQNPRYGWSHEIKPSKEYPGMIHIPDTQARKIFVCSTFEIFHPSVKAEWRNWIFDIIEYYPQHTFQILTKMPENIDRPMPDNVWLGVSITGAGDQERMAYLSGIKAKTKFISWEPLLANPLPPGWRIPKCVNWVIVGRLTGHGKKHDPKIDLIADLIIKAHIKNVPIFLKNNLKEIWYGKLIQGFPLAISVVKSDRQ